MSLPTSHPSCDTQERNTTSAKVVLRIHDLNKNISSNRIAFFGCLILLYIGISIAFYTGYEDMSVLDAVYYAIITMATVRYVAAMNLIYYSELFIYMWLSIGSLVSLTDWNIH